MPLRILSAGSTLHGVRECVAHAPFAPGAIEVATDHGHNIRHAVMHGTTEVDVVLIPADMIAELETVGHTRNRVALGTVGIGGVVRVGSSIPEIGTMAQLRASLVAADAVLLTHAPTGDHLLKTIAKLGLSEMVTSKLLRFDTSTKLNVHLAARTDNVFGFGPETEIRAGKGVMWIGDVPPEIQIALPYAAAILTKTKAPDEADAFLEFLSTKAASDIFGRSGVR